MEGGGEEFLRLGCGSSLAWIWGEVCKEKGALRDVWMHDCFLLLFKNNVLSPKHYFSILILFFQLFKCNFSTLFFSQYS
jgi:hypothetical protein